MVTREIITYTCIYIFLDKCIIVTPLPKKKKKKKKPSFSKSLKKCDTF